MKENARQTPSDASRQKDAYKSFLAYQARQRPRRRPVDPFLKDMAVAAVVVWSVCAGSVIVLALIYAAHAIKAAW